MNQPAKAQEPSMEEILASIRRIIADDDVPKTESAPVEPPTLPSRPTVVASPLPAERAPRQAEINAMLTQLSAPVSSPSVVEPQAADVLELTEAMAASPPAHVEGFRTIDGGSDLMFEGDAQESVAQPVAPAPARVPPIEEARRQPPSELDRALMSSVTSAAVDSAFNSLAHTVLVQNARTLEDLVREMLRPMLKSWLDDNLPSVVERLVRAEIERVSRGRG
jgi:cell pole-organizing protein PopZ